MDKKVFIKVLLKAVIYALTSLAASLGYQSI